MIYQWKLYRMPLYEVTMNYKWVAQDLAEVHRPLLYRLALLPGAIFLTLTPIILAAGLYGLVRGFRQRLGRDFALIFLIYGAVTICEIASSGLLPLARYSITLGTLLAVASGYGVEQVASLLSQRKAGQSRLAVSLLLVLNLGGIFALSRIPNPFNNKFRSISPALRFQRRIESLGRYLKPRLGHNARVVIDDFNTDGITIAHVIGLPLIPYKRAFLASRDNLPDLLDYMEKNHPRYLIYSDRGIIRSLLPLPAQCCADTTMGMRFRCRFENNIYRIYGVSYQYAPATLATSR